MNILTKALNTLPKAHGACWKRPPRGEELTPIVHTNSFWFAVGAFKPDTKIYQGVG